MSPHCSTRSAFDKNFRAKANSRNPRTTFTVLGHPPDFGCVFNQLGNKAKTAKGRARAAPNPPIPAVSCIAPPSAVSEPANSEPSKGPVQENETMLRLEP